MKSILMFTKCSYSNELHLRGHHMVCRKLKKDIQQEKIKRIIGFVILLILILLLLWGYYILTLPPARTLSELAYDTNKLRGYTVYLEEETGYHPYLVVTKEYGKDNTVLLLRKYVLDEWQPFDEIDYYDSYYGRSHIDEYLNTVYLKTLDSETRNQIEITAVDLTARTAWGSNGRDVPLKEELPRKVFLLSDIEVGNKKMGSIREGEPLKYFTDDIQRLVTTHTDGERSNWSLRTGALETAYKHYGLGFELGLGLLASRAPTGVRPAFCFKGEVEVIQSDEIVNEETVYILKREKE